MALKCFLLVADSPQMMCSHNGIVQLQSTIPQCQVQGIPACSTQDVANAKIVGCTHKIRIGNAWIPKPCTHIVNPLDCAMENGISDGVAYADAKKASSLKTNNNVAISLQSPLAESLGVFV